MNEDVIAIRIGLRLLLPTPIGIGERDTRAIDRLVVFDVLNFSARFAGEGIGGPDNSAQEQQSNGEEGLYSDSADSEIIRSFASAASEVRHAAF